MEEIAILDLSKMDRVKALRLTELLGPRCYAVKIHDLYDLEGPGFVNRLLRQGAKRVWVDAKLHDTPDTVEARARAIANSGAKILSVHVGGGPEMLAACAKGFEFGEVFGISVLTSISDEIAAKQYKESVAGMVELYSQWAEGAGLDGMVCSAREVGSQKAGLGFKYVVPGTRSTGAATHDQQRSETPKFAIDHGATHLVLGRQVTAANDPVAAFDAIESEIGASLNTTA